MNDRLAPLPTGSRTAHLLARLLEHPELVQAVRSMPASVLGKVIAKVGLEDAGEIVALATTEQLVAVFDVDLWNSASPGDDESFDADRFLIWLQILAEAGEDALVRRLTELPEDLLTMALHRHVLVVALEDLRAEFEESEEPDQLDKALEGHLSEEIDDFQVLARGHDGWDVVLSALLALDRDHHDMVVRLLERLAHLSRRSIDDQGGLYEVLTAAESLRDDVAGDRDDRRAADGYVSPAQARSFFRLARTANAGVVPGKTDPVMAAWLRELAPVARPEAQETSWALLRELVDDDVAPRPKRRPKLRGKDAEADAPLLSAAMAELAEADPAVFARRSEELAFLANALVAGCPGGRRFRPGAAAEAAIATVSLGLDLAGSPPPTLSDRSTDTLFKFAFHELHHAIVLPAARALHRLLARHGGADASAAARALEAAIARDEPWRALDEASSVLVGRDEPWAHEAEALLTLVDPIPSVEGTCIASRRRFEAVRARIESLAAVGRRSTAVTRVP